MSMETREIDKAIDRIVEQNYEDDPHFIPDRRGSWEPEELTRNKNRLIASFYEGWKKVWDDAVAKGAEEDNLRALYSSVVRRLERMEY